jgi:hypothetical protein
MVVRSARRFGLGALLLLGLLLAGSGTIGAQVQPGATLTAITGTLAVVFGNGSAVQPAPSGTVVRTDDRVATLANSEGLLTFFEGSELQLTQNTTILVRELRISGSEVHITVEDVLGTATGRLASFVNPSSSLSLQSPGGRVIAIIRGSFARLTVFGPDAFQVEVGDCTRPCEIRVDGRTVFQGTGGGAFTIDARGVSSGLHPPELTTEEERDDSQGSENEGSSDTDGGDGG